MKHLSQWRPLIPRAVSGGLMLSAVLTGCAVGPDYQAPQIDMAPFHNTDGVADRQARLPAPKLDHWWTGFNDPMLETVVRRALDQNLSLQAALARVVQARAVAQAAGAQLLPTIDAVGSAAKQHQSLNSPLGTMARTFPNYSRSQEAFSVGASASWEIDLAGGLRRSRAAALAEAQAAEADRLGSRVTVAADAADAYLQIRGLQARIAVTQDQIDTDVRLLRLVQARLNAGAADSREVAQAEALVRQARSILPIFRTALEAQLNRLDVLMGVQPGTYATELSTSRVAVIPDVPAIDTGDRPIDVLRRRPDIIAAERRLAASNENIGVAIADYYPKISLSGALGFDSIAGGQLFKSASFQAVGAAGFSWRVFDFGKVDAEVKLAKGAYAQALAEYRESTLKAVQDVEDAFMALVQAELRSEELMQEVAALTRARDLSESAYRAGSITLTDVLDADRELLVSRDALDASKTDAARAAVRAFRAMGGGWEYAIQENSFFEGR